MTRINNKPCKVKSNLLMSDLLVYKPEIFSAVPVEQARSTYYELREVQDENGYHEELVEVDYPITADYVKSFESSSNYKTDVDGAIAQGHNKQNLGNIVDMQEVYSMDSVAIEELANKMKAYADSLKTAEKTAEKNNVKEGE